MSTPPAPVGRRAPQRFGRRGWFTLIGTLMACYLTGFAVLNLASTSQGAFLNRLFPHVGSSNLDLRSINAAWSLVQQQYVIRDVGGGLGTEGTERGMIDMLKATPRFHDRFSAFLTRDQAAALSADLGGERTGSIGVALEPRCGGKTCPAGVAPTEIVIEKVLRGQPADQAGLRNGDVLTAVDGMAVRSPLTPDQPIDQQVRQIRGKAGTSVRLSVSRTGQPITLTARRADLRIPSVYAQRFGTTLYLQITAFNNDTAATARRQLQSALDLGATSVVLDLRHNGGGYVTAAQSLASEFLARTGGGQDDVVVRRGRLAAADRPESAEQVTHDRILPGGVALTAPLVVLVDGQSASASEIVAAALKDYGRATLVGVKTFGKGSVQLDLPLPDGADLHLTVEKWYGPRGESIDEKGVEPQRQVAMPDVDNRFQLDAQSADPTQDPQLGAALTLAQAPH